MIGLIDTVDIMTEGATGLSTVPLVSGLRCRLAHQAVGGATGNERAELSQMRRMIWDATPVLPEAIQIVASDGTRYNALTGTFRALRGPSGTILYRSCDVVRAVDG